MNIPFQGPPFHWTLTEKTQELSLTPLPLRPHKSAADSGDFSVNVLSPPGQHLVQARGLSLLTGSLASTLRGELRPFLSSSRVWKL